ncbi:hypothetical protein PR202_ga17160 [Eleusine coracana subsp. coracana]|uniref:Disease resistance R13L4/SHOC-2-like LRR domain-containing protein n=1 Tax=Eleusine coracana subsp. coracana TaxID=191504 RepID=A0AAV5CNH7_ELECO|nr:hypothetical protein PR202_ga17160 [Eleusine coracana subsp. coracana]
MPDCFRNLTQLVKIQLWWSRLDEDRTIDILGGLPKLMFLNLNYSAYDGKKLVVRQGALQNLIKIDIWSQFHLTEIGFEQGASPKLESIEISCCRLKSGIYGIKHLPKLKDIYLCYGSKVARLGMLQKEVNLHHSKPVLRLQKDRNYHDLGDTDGPDEFFEAMESLSGNTEEN